MAPAVRYSEMKQSCALFLSFSMSVCATAAQAAPGVTFSGNMMEVIELPADKNTGLDRIYVASTAAGLVIEAPAVDGQPLTSWQMYDNRGGGFATDVEGLERQGSTTLLRNPQGNRGYLLRWGDATTFYFWLTDYSSSPLHMTGLQLPDAPDCGMTTLTLQGDGDAIHYFTVTGRQMTLDRDIRIAYSTLEWSSEGSAWRQTDTAHYVQQTGQVFISPPPLCNTTFTATGDRFLERWGLGEEVVSAPFVTTAVAVETTAERTNRPAEGSNQSGGSEGGLGGSAPADVSFRAYITDAVLHSEWQFSAEPDFGNLTHRFNQQDLDFTFSEEGTTYVRFVGSNSDGSCEAVGETYVVSIGASELRIPNAFSPGAETGGNSVWKVSYRSLVSFQCWIFDRYGTQLYHFDSPDGGWDGRYKGKFVRPGVYYYVIEATGADGKRYKKGGDINILRYRGAETSGQNPQQ